MRKKPIYLTGIILTLTVIFGISSCSDIKKEPLEAMQQTPSITAAISKTPSVTLQSSLSSEVEVSTTSFIELIAFFDALNYSRDNCTATSCAIPRITFNKVSDNWKEASSQLPVKVKKDLFFRLMTPLILIANENIAAERKTAQDSALNSPAFKALALKYKLLKSDQTPVDQSLREKLLQRIDILPPSLALAQAAEESGWATSRFAREGNAFFGQWDYSGKGMTPSQQRTNLGNYSVARFATPLACVEAYMFNINTNAAYQKLRTLRAQLRLEKKTVTGSALADTLDKYSERGQAYTEGLHTMINYNKLAPLDQAYLTSEQLIRITIN